MTTEIDWRKIAKDLHDHLSRNYCWHCGHESGRDYKTDEALTAYRDATIDEGPASYD